MKKFIVSILVLFVAISLFGCTPKGEYKLTVHDNFDLLVNNNLKKSYKPGEVIRIKLAFRSGVTVGLRVDDGEVEVTEIAKLQSEFEFVMPNHNCEVYTTLNGKIKSDCGEENHKWDEGRYVPETTSGGENGFMVYFCIDCGKQKSEPHVHEYVDGVCKCGEKVKLSTGNYRYFSDDENVSTITLEANGKFSFVFSPISSYLGFGNYTVENGYLYLKSSSKDTQIWVFKIEDKKLIYNSEKSTGGLYLSNITDGSEFIYGGIN